MDTFSRGELINLMKKIVITISIITAGLFFFDGLFSFFIQENRNIKLSNAMKGNMEYDILFHGPCEPLFTVNPSKIDSLIGTNSYNYALRHTDFADNYLHLYLYLKANEPPKQVYLYVTPESFDIRFNSFHTYRFAPYLKDSVVAEVVKDMDPDYFSKSKFPFMRFAYYNSYKTFNAVQGIKHYLQEKSEAYFKDGYVAHPDNIFHTRPDGYIAPQHLIFSGDMNVTELTDSSLYYELYKKRQSFNWNKKRAHYLSKLFELCKQYKIELILYESPAYHASIVDQPNRDVFLIKTDSIAKKHNSEYLILNDSLIAFDKTNFVCPLILSVKGTKLFLELFSDSIQSRLK